MNYIEKIRNEIQRYYNPEAEIAGSGDVIISPNGNYSAKTTVFRQTKPLANWEVTKVELYETNNMILLRSFFINDGTFFHSWVNKNNVDYLLCSEDQCGGQTVIDMTNNKMSSFTQNDDGFIWTKHFLSPSGNLLAVFGCGWGSPFFVIVYFFENPLELPLKIAYEPEWTGYDVIGWADDKSLKVKNTDSSGESILDF